MWIRVLLLLLLTASVADAQPKKANPFKSKQFWITLAVRVGLAVADAESTVSAQRRNPLFREQNPLFSDKPGRGELYSKGAAVEAGLTLLTASIWRKNERAGRTFDGIHTGLRVIGHSIAINTNRGVKARVCPSGTSLIDGTCT